MDDPGAADAARGVARPAHRVGRSGGRADRRSRRSAPSGWSSAATSPEPEREREQVEAARELGGAAAMLAFSVLADSGLEHYRGAYHNPAMYVAPSAAAVSLVNSVHMTLRPEVSSNGRLALSGLTLSTGLTGLAFHLANVAKRDGGVNLLNLFYGAPLLAPGAIAISGLAGLAAARLVARPNRARRRRCSGGPPVWSSVSEPPFPCCPRPRKRRCCISAAPFTIPFMYIPVTLPPVAALVLAGAACNRACASPLACCCS